MAGRRMDKISKRKVFYLGGYDPRGARHYYNLYKKEALKNNKIDSMQIEVSSRKKETKRLVSWDILAKENEKETKTHYYFFIWDDLIRKKWKKTLYTFVLDLFTYFKFYLLSSLIFRYIKLYPSVLLSLWYPLFYMFFTLLLLLIVFWTIPWLLPSSIEVIVLYLIWLVCLSFVLYLSIRLSHKVAVSWLFRALCFYVNYLKEEDKSLSEGVENLGDYIIDALHLAQREDIDEISIVAHSAGTILIIDLLAHILKAFPKDAPELEKLSILTLGHFIPLVSFQKEAFLYRQKMQEIASYSLLWLDYTSVIDRVTFYLSDYFKESVVLEDKGRFYALSPRFHTLYRPKSYKKIKKDIHSTHFLYLYAPEILGTYNYFRFTAGDKRLSSFIPRKI
jgi:hypothetical protein